mmetsp:Transcript_35701/g.79410  ORF Transcript_35701/g.79410 Transcript_35701/m.79410 type:complete len:139 (+) Transcript_35701:392-808(+)
MAAASQAAGLQKVLALYRHILRLHRQKMPTPLVDLGNSYVRSEFRSHLRGKTTQPQWVQFVKSWQDYARILTGDGEGLATPLDSSGHLRPEVQDAMSDDQKRRMVLLREEAARLGGAGIGEHDAGISSDEAADAAKRL